MGISLLIVAISVFAQTSTKEISVSEVSRIERTLSSDEMQGRKIFTPGIDKAAAFIADEFKKVGLKPLSGDSYFQTFNMERRRFIAAHGTLDGKEITERDIVAFSSKDSFTIDNNSGYIKAHIGSGDTLYASVQRLLASGKNYFVTVDSVHARLFNNIKLSRRESMPLKNAVVLVLAQAEPAQYRIQYQQEITSLKLKNVVGILRGKKRKDEYVIFSGHYDHLGIGKVGNNADSIYNGANDDASGTTAVITLANYFKNLKDNERSIVFAAFTGEESGGFGSRYFSEQFDPAKVVAMFNIEMIGTESKWGKNSAYITGYERTDMGKTLEKNLQGTGFTFYPDPYPDQQLFYRSDNATLARLGVPAHTISTSKMDSEKNYHTVYDEFETLDMNNMAEIIRAIALSSKSIVKGTDTPSRVDTTQLR
jgi:hypothetical protein